MITLHTPGYPRIGAHRELKTLLEDAWSGRTDAAGLRAGSADLRREQWRQQSEAGLDLATTGDFSLYDHVLDTSLLLGAVPARFRSIADPLALSFAMGRGTTIDGARVAACEMTKWFDTNYHFIVPEIERDTHWSLRPEAMLDEVDAAIAAGFLPKPVILGPITWLWLAKSADAGVDRLALLATLLPLYGELLALLARRGVGWAELDEPILALDLGEEWRSALYTAYGALGGLASRPRILLASYFGPLGDNLGTAADLPVDGLHLDAASPGARAELARAVGALADGGKVLSVGIVDGRNIWRTDLTCALDLLEPIHAALGERLWLAPSCSLLHVPVSLDDERALDPRLRSWLAFAREKLAELQVLRQGLLEGRAAVAGAIAASEAAIEARRSDPRVRVDSVRAGLAAGAKLPAERRAARSVRSRLQRARFQLPAFPTTTIGSFPQTQAIRRARKAYRVGEIDQTAYRRRIEAEIAAAIAEQEAIGLDVLVHGEAERSDMVEYFGEQLEGFAFTDNGWVQSYGSRCVKPPIIYGDVERRQQMTVSWSRYAQSLTAKPVKGMLTGPVTMVKWAFVRDDQPASETVLQVALALRDEVLDLERNGIGMIQIDEPALREGLPLRQSEREAYLAWAVRAFRVASSAVTNQTQIHTHMCYCDFDDIIEAIAALDADVITIESARSGGESLSAWRDSGYPGEIGPGVYDIHSPTVPSTEEMGALLLRAAAVIDPDRLWVNPDCGLKTRDWGEVRPALANMVAAARAARARLASRVAEAV